MSGPKSIGHFITKFLGDYIPRQRNLSINTIHSYAWTFRLFFKFCLGRKKLAAEKMFVDSFDMHLVTEFLDWLESERSSSGSSRNQRLSAMRSLFRFIQYEEPEYMAVCQRIMSIPNKKTPRPDVGHFEERALKAILAEPDTESPSGKRALALLTLLYDTGARVSELANIRIKDIHYVDLLYVTLFGKGSKKREVAIMPETFTVLTSYMKAFGLHLDHPDQRECPLFFNSRREPLTRSGVSHIVKRYADAARRKCATIPHRVSPHVFRHTKAVHLCDLGVPQTNIRDILGHASVKTTEIYARLSLKQKSEYLTKSTEGVEAQYHICEGWEKEEGILEWLDKLCK